MLEPSRAQLPKAISPGIFPVAMVFTTYGSMLLPIGSGVSLVQSLARVLMAPAFQARAAHPTPVHAEARFAAALAAI